MPFAVGAEVVVATVGNKRGVVVDAAGERYRVRIGNLLVTCREADLAAVEERTTKKAARSARHSSDVTASEQPARSVRVDLHGLTVEESIARLVDVIDRAILDGADRIEVVHGKGSGRVKDAVHRQLSTMRVVAAFKLDERNTGITWVYL
jgi:DNA mismatch repair protein MutS2